MTQILSPGAIPDPEPALAEVEEWQENLNIHLVCPECREMPPNLYEDHQSGDTICESCGMVLGQRGIDTRAEWRTFANDDQGNDDPSRVGDAPNPLLNGNQLHTSISFGDGSMRSKELHRAQNKATADKSNKGLLQAFKQIGAYCDSKELPQTVSDGAKHIYKDADESKLFKGKSQEAIIAGCIFISCRRNNQPRTFREIFELTKVSKKEIGRTFKLLERFLMEQDKKKGGKTVITAGGMYCYPSNHELIILTRMLQGVAALNEKYEGTTTTSPGELCERFGTNLGLDFRCRAIAKAIADKMSTVGALAGRSPLSGAAACIYMASCLMNQPRSPKQVSEVAKVSDSTIRNAYKSLYNERDNLIEKDWLEKGGDLERLPKPS